MHPILWQGYGFILPSWHFFYLLAALSALFFLLYLRRAFTPEIPISMVKGLYSCGYLGGYAGARLGSILIEQRGEIANANDFFDYWFSFGPMNFYGGLIGASLCGLLYLRLVKAPFFQLADLAFPCGFLALSIGRIGCFLNGDDYGSAIEWQQGQPVPWWAVVFPEEMQGKIVPRVPVQLWESAAALLLVSFGLRLFKLGYAKNRPGLIAAASLGGYAIFRFILEFFRADPRGELFSSALSPAQWISLGLLLVLLAQSLRAKPRHPEALHASASLGRLREGS